MNYVISEEYLIQIPKGLPGDRDRQKFNVDLTFSW